jgi:type IV pilus assembly protein PilA
MQYLIWEHKKLGAKTASQAELSFTGPRHGSAAWLANPGPLPSLDFISPDAITAGAFMLTNLGQIFEDVKDLMGSGSASPIASLPQMEKALGLTLKDDLLGPLGGELAFELDSVTPQPAWKAMLSVKDADHLQKTLSTVMAAAQIKPEQTEDGGVIYHNVFIPSSPRPYEIDYAFLDGYLIVSSTHTALADAVKLHRSGGSLAKSPKLQASRPPGHSLEASALLYENPVALAALQLRRFAPGLEDSLLSATKDATPAVICLYGEESAISEASSSGALDVGGALVVAAIAIPNLLKSKVAANEASAVGSLRTINTAQVTYEATYPKRGFAPNLAALGPDPRSGTAESPEHADLIDASLGGPTCTGDAWCIKSGYQFRITAYCKEHLCGNYLAVAMPVSESSGTRNFCTTSDGLIRLQLGAPLTSRLTAAECRKWPPLQ